MGVSKAFKVVMCGDGGVGKTSLVSRLVGAGFNPLQKLTVGVSHHTKELNLGDSPTRLVVWDLGGEERFRFLAPVFLRGAKGAIFVFDVTREETFEHLDEWLEVVIQTIGDIPRVLVGNKVDLEGLRVIPSNYAERYAKSKGYLAYYEVSARLGSNVEEPFIRLAKAILGCDHGG
ncbi:MAG: GTP-binding protein [Thermofilaceae archaeon]|nr:GTP-binding protein [Thermofilaceae archaeon]